MARLPLTRRLRLALALAVSAAVTGAYTVPAAGVAGAEVLLLHGFFLIDLSRRPRSAAEGQDERAWVIRSKIFLVALLYLPIVFMRVFPRHPPLEVAGIGITVLGGLLLLWGRVSLGRMATESLTIIEGHTLFTGGPYRVIRHPIYSGLVLAFLGHQLTFGFLPGLVLWLLFIRFVVHPRIVVEETMLLDRFPETYARYRQESRRLFPCIY